MEAAIDVAFTQRERPTLVIVRTSIDTAAQQAGHRRRARSAAGRPRSLSRRNASGGPRPPFLVPDDVLAHFRERSRAGDAEKRGVKLPRTRRFPALALEWSGGCGATSRRMAEGSRRSRRGRRDGDPKCVRQGAERDRREGPELAADPGPAPRPRRSSRRGSSCPTRSRGPERPLRVREHGWGVLNEWRARRVIRSAPPSSSFRTTCVLPSACGADGCRVVYVLTHDSVGVGETADAPAGRTPRVVR